MIEKRIILNVSRFKRLEAIILNRFTSLLQVRTRFLISLLVVLIVKMIGGIILYHRLNMGMSETYWMTARWSVESQNEVFKLEGDGLRWLYLFLGWDSAWYLSISVKGYLFSTQSFAFFPGLPLFTMILNLIGDKPLLTIVLFSTFVGILWIPLYQLIAELYLDRAQALKSTLLFAFFPYVFLFTTIVYSESLFLFSTLGAWYFFKREHFLVSIIFVSIATIARPPGLLILFPIVLEIVREYMGGISPKRRYILYLVFPILSFFSWLLYCKIMVNDWFAPFTRSAWDNMPSFFRLLLTQWSYKDVQFLHNTLHIWVFLLLTPILIYALRQLDRSLGSYSAVYYLGVMAFGGLLSVPRFISFLFPIWFPLTLKLSQVKKSNVITILICTVFCVVGFFLWNEFLDGEFVS